MTRSLAVLLAAWLSCTADLLLHPIAIVAVPLFLVGLFAGPAWIHQPITPKG